MVLAFVAVSVPASLAFIFLVNTTVTKLGTLFAEKQVLFDRYRGLGALMQEVKLAETLAGSSVILDWARNEADPARRGRAIAELEHYRQTFADHSYFFVVDKSGNYYFNDAQNSYNGRQFSHTLDAANPRDGWYYTTRTYGSGCHLNVDHDDVLGVTKVWINCVITDGGTVLGVLGTGLDLSAFIQDVVDVPQTGVTAMFVDRTGAVQAHRDPRLVDFHSLTKDAAAKRTVYSLIDRPEDQDAMRQMLQDVTRPDVEVRSRFMLVDGHEVLVGVGYLDQLGWYNVTMMDVDKIIDRGLFVPIGLLLGSIMLACILLLGWVFRRKVLDRIERVEAGFATARAGDLPATPLDTGSDEIGRMSAVFASMADVVNTNTRTLERMVEERTEQLRSIAYRDQMTGILNRRGFIETFDGLRAAPDAGGMALMLIDIDAFKIINDTYGHQVGDLVMIEVARRLEDLTRNGDACGRWGGDELILMMTHLDPASSLAAVAKSVKDALSSRPIPVAGDLAIEITLSIGATQMSADDGIGTATDLADAALYRAKSEGRDRAICFDPDWGAGQRRRA